MVEFWDKENLAQIEIQCSQIQNTPKVSKRPDRLTLQFFRSFSFSNFNFLISSFFSLILFRAEIRSFLKNSMFSSFFNFSFSNFDFSISSFFSLILLRAEILSFLKNSISWFFLDNSKLYSKKYDINL